MVTKIGNSSLYIHTHKVASQSIGKLLKKFSGKELSDKNFLDDFSIENLKKYKLIFSFVRNPYSRMISSWKHTIGLGNSRNFAEHIDFLSTIDMKDRDFLKDCLNNIDQNYKEPDRWIIHHSIPLSTYFEIENKLYSKIIIGKFEEINQDWLTISDQIYSIENLNLRSLRHLNSSKYPAPVNIENKTLGKIYQIYRKDFENFNYSIDYNE